MVAVTFALGTAAPDASAIVQRALTADGVRLTLGAAISGVAEGVLRLEKDELCGELCPLVRLADGLPGERADVKR